MEDIIDGDSDEAKQVQPQNRGHENSHGMPYDLNKTMITYQLEDREWQLVHGVLNMQPQGNNKKGL